MKKVILTCTFMLFCSNAFAQEFDAEKFSSDLEDIKTQLGLKEEPEETQMMSRNDVQLLYVQKDTTNAEKFDVIAEDFESKSHDLINDNGQSLVLRFVTSAD